VSYVEFPSFLFVLNCYLFFHINLVLFRPQHHALIFIPSSCHFHLFLFPYSRRSFEIIFFVLKSFTFVVITVCSIFYSVNLTLDLKTLKFENPRFVSPYPTTTVTLCSHDVAKSLVGTIVYIVSNSNNEFVLIPEAD